MNNESMHQASLRIISSYLSVSDITNIIGLSPSRSKEKGELLSPRNVNSQRRDSSLWSIESGLSDSAEMEEHIEKIISIIENKLSELQSIMSKCEMDIFCGVFLKNDQHSFTLNSKMLKRLSIIPLDLVFDLYRNS